MFDTAIGGPWNWIGDVIVSQGCEDSSGLRRALMETLVEDNYELFNGWVPVSEHVFNTLRDRLKAIRSYDGNETPDP